MAPPPPDRGVSDPAIWNRYWKFDRIASCFDGDGERNYDESVAAGWRAFFGSLPDGTRLLDLCTGNGAAALIAAEVGLANHKGFEIVAVDRAEIDPPAHVSRHRQELATIDFRPGTAAEALPFDDRSFGAVVSQYGIEYSDLERSLPELVRVLAPGGRVRLVMHAAEGVVAADARQVRDEADFLLDGVDLPGTARRCFVDVTGAERNPAADEEAHRKARESLSAFEGALAETAKRIPAAMDKAMLRRSGAVLLDTFKRHGRLDVDQLVAKAEEVRDEIEAHRGRLQALIEAAVTRTELGELASRLRAAGADEVEPSDLSRGPALIGHVLEARFPA